MNIALMGRGGEERFRREGRVLAKLTHANVARILDAGVTQSSQPYLADGVVKLLDFGIAKLIEDDSKPDAVTLLTQDGNRSRSPGPDPGT